MVAENLSPSLYDSLKQYSLRKGAKTAVGYACRYIDNHLRTFGIDDLRELEENVSDAALTAPTALNENLCSLAYVSELRDWTENIVPKASTV